MNNNLKLLIIFGIPAAIAICLGLFLSFVLPIPWWANTLGVFGALWGFRVVMDRVVDHKRISKSLDHYDSMTHKKFRVNLLCQSCGQTNVVEMDLGNSEFDCQTCESKNAIYTNFSTALVTEPMFNSFDQVSIASGDIQAKLEQRMHAVAEKELNNTVHEYV